MRVLSLDAMLGGGTDEFTFHGTISLFDYDVVVWDPKESIENYQQYRTTYKGRDCLGDADSAALIRDIARRRAEFLDFANSGGSIVVLVPGDCIVFAATGKVEYSGTGRNRQSTREVTEVDILRALPASLERTYGQGTEIAPANELGARLYRDLGSVLAYESLIASAEPPLTPLLHVKGTDKVVAGLRRTKGRGHLILLPRVFLETEELDDSDYSPGGDGDRQDLGDLGSKLLDWIALVTADDEEPPPPWVERFASESELRRAAALVDLEVRLGDLVEQIDELKAKQAAEARWKVLLHGSGRPLERQVAEALELLGFAVNDAAPGRTDLRAQRGDQTVVVEVKGTAKSGAEKHAAQLEKWVAEEIAGGATNVKGILVVNGWRDLPLDERTEPTFPDQMHPYSVQRGHCLLTGTQLFAMAKACIDYPDRTDEIADLLVGGVGVVAGWGDLGLVEAPSRVNVGEPSGDGGVPPDALPSSAS